MYKKWIQFILWFGYYRWKNDNRAEWEKEFRKDEFHFKRIIKEYHEERRNIHDKTITMINILIPELKKFSDKIHTFDKNWYKIEDIIKWEGLENK